MKLAALVSGGKDSIFAIQQLVDQGHEFVCLIHLVSTDDYNDSYMYQTVGSEIVDFFEEAMGIPLIKYFTNCKTINVNLDYKETKDDEVEDLFNAISTAHLQYGFEGISSGAIRSTYQKNRVENICKRLNLKSLAPLWERDQKTLLAEMIDSGIDARVTKIATPSIVPSLLGKDIKVLFQHLKNSNETNFCGEGGEYESSVMDCTLFKKKIYFDNITICCHPEDANKANGFKVMYCKYNNIRCISKQ